MPASIKDRDLMIHGRVPCLARGERQWDPATYLPDKYSELKRIYFYRLVSISSILGGRRSGLMPFLTTQFKTREVLRALASQVSDSRA
jgi:hypothetical protein